MNVQCHDREWILREQDPEALAALEAHAAECSACREELDSWSELSAAARSLQRHWDSPQLWPKIREQLLAETRAQDRQGRWRLLDLWLASQAHWQAVAVAAAVVILAVVSARLLIPPHGTRLVPGPTPSGAASQPARKNPLASESKQDTEKRLLTEQALQEIESTESAYIRAIDKLAAQVRPQIQNPTSPLLMNYHEKLTLLDNAIAECRANIDQNRYNAYLRREMLSIYQEKRRTLEQLQSEVQHGQP